MSFPLDIYIYMNVSSSQFFDKMSCKADPNHYNAIVPRYRNACTELLLNFRLVYYFGFRPTLSESP